MPKAWNRWIVFYQTPFIQVTMLEDPMATEIVLAHRPSQGMDGFARHGVILAPLPPRQMERFLVPVNVAVEEIGVLVHPQGQLQRVP